MSAGRVLAAATLLLAAACSSGESAITAGQDDPTTPSTAAPSATAPDGTTPTGTADVTATTAAAPSPTTTTIAVDEIAECPTSALDDATGPVTITYWHGMNSESEKALQAIVAQYNAAQDRVVVDLQNQGGYLEVIDKYYQSGESGRPDLVMFPEFGFQQAIDSDTIIPMAACVDDAGFDLSPIQPAAVEAYSTAGIQWGMPFNVSNPILYYNMLMFEEAGLDPASPPATLDELRVAAQAIVDSGAATYGIALDTSIDAGGGWFIEQWFANAGELFVNHGNGREAPATEVVFDGPTGVELMTFLQEMVADGLAVNVGDNAAGSENFLKLADANEPAAMTIGTSAALGTVISVLGSGLVPGLTTDDVGIGPLPGFGGPPTAIVGGAANYIVADDDPTVVAAAWDFVTYLVTPEIQSQWAAATGYLPIVDEAIDVEPLRTTYADDPRFRVAYTQLANTPDDLAHAGPQIGPHRQVRDQVAAALAAIYDGADVETTLAAAAAASDALLQQYLALNA